MERIVVERAIANIMFNKLMEHFDDPEGISSIVASPEFAIVQELQTQLDLLDVPDGTEGSVDFYFVVGVWNDLHEGVDALNKKHEDLLMEIAKVYEITLNDPFQIFGSLIKHDIRIIQRLSEQYKDPLRSYVSKGNEILDKFKSGLLAYYLADLTDRILDCSSVIDEKNIQQEHVEVNGTVIYLDQNAVSSIVHDARVMRECLKGVADGKITFVYSAYLIEDSINMNPLFLTEFINDLFSLTKGRLVTLRDGQLCYVRENLEATICRVRLYSEMTKYFEKHRLIKVIRHFHDYPALRNGKTFSNELKGDVLSFFSNPSSSSIPGFDHVVAHFGARPLISGFIKNGCLAVVNADQKGRQVDEMLELFDFINFGTEVPKRSNHTKIASSYRDNQHVAHAHIAEIFLTDDKKMRSRAESLYPLIGYATKVMGFKEFRNHLSELL